MDKPSSGRWPTETVRWRRWLFGSLIALSAAVICSPWIAAATRLRDPIINWIMDDPDLVASARAASFGWTSPLSLDDAQVFSTDERVRISIDRVEADRSWLRMLLDSPNLGAITLHRPNVVVRLPLLDSPATETIGTGPTLSVTVSQLELLVTVGGLEEPVLHLPDVSLSARIDSASEGRILSVDPFTLFENAALTTEICNEVLQLIDPVIADVLDVQGEVSLSISRIRIPLDLEDQARQVQDIRIRGVVKLHHVKAELKTPLLKGIVRILANANGLRDIPDVLEVAQDMEISFDVRDGRVFHDGLEIKVPAIDPDLVIRSRGSVGIDQSLDLTVEAPRWVLDDQPIPPANRTESVRVRVGGTIDEPRITLLDDSTGNETEEGR